MTRHEGTSSPVVITLAGDVDIARQPGLEAYVAHALHLARPVVVDLGDCTFLGALALELLAEESRRARALGIGLVIVLPYGADPLVRRTLLEIAPDLASLSIAPSLAAAAERATRLTAGRHTIRVELRQLLALRAAVWEEGARLGELQLRRDLLLFEQRQALERVRQHRRSPA